jgi:hypothetical protein
VYLFISHEVLIGFFFFARLIYSNALNNLLISVSASSSQQRESLPSSPRETTPFESDSSSGSSPYEDFHE